MRRKLTAAAAALLLLLLTAAPAQAVGYGGTAPYARHYAYTYAGWDYSWTGSLPGSAYGGGTCVGHTDTYKSRRVLCPWCTWYTNLKVHCTQV